MTIEAIKYFSNSGIECDGIFGVDSFPYGSSNVQHDGGPVGARWKHDKQDFFWQTHDKVSIYPSPDFTCLVVVFLRNAPLEFSPPHNALVLNADGSLRFQIRQPARYAGRKTEFLYARWYERTHAEPSPPWWAIWHSPAPARKELRLKMLVGGEIGVPNMDFEALDFDPESGEFGEVVSSGRF